MTASVLARYSKAAWGALVGALIGGLTSLVTALGDGTMTPEEWAKVALAFVVGLGVTGAGVALAPANRDYTDDDVRDDPTSLED